MAGLSRTECSGSPVFPKLSPPAHSVLLATGFCPWHSEEPALKQHNTVPIVNEGSFAAGLAIAVQRSAQQHGQKKNTVQAEK